MCKHLTSRLNWNLEVLVFVEGKNLENSKKPLGARTEPATNSTHVPTTGTEPGSQRCEASAPTATPTLLPTNVKKGDCRKKVKQRDCLNLVNDMKIKKGDCKNLLHKSQIGVGGFKLKVMIFVLFWSELG